MSLKFKQHVTIEVIKGVVTLIAVILFGGLIKMWMETSLEKQRKNQKILESKTILVSELAELVSFPIARTVQN